MASEKIRVSYRFPPRTVEKIKQLIEWTDADATSTIVRGIHEFHERETIRRNAMGISIEDLQMVIAAFKSADENGIDLAALVETAIAEKSAENL